MRERVQGVEEKDPLSNFQRRKVEAYKDFDELYEKLDIGVSDAAVFAFDIWRQNLFLESFRDLTHAEIEMYDMRGEPPHPSFELTLETIASKWIRLQARKERVRIGLALRDQSGDELNKFDQTYDHLKEALPQLEDIELEEVLAPGVRLLGASFKGVSSASEMSHHPDFPTEKLAKASAKYAVWRETKDLYGWLRVPTDVELPQETFPQTEQREPEPYGLRPQLVYEPKPKWRSRAKEVFASNMGKLRGRRNK